VQQTKECRLEAAKYNGVLSNAAWATVAPAAGVHDALRIEEMAMKLWPALCFSVALLPNAVLAQDYVLKSLKIDRPFARATPPGAKTGGVFFTVENRGEIGDTLIRASSPIAGTVELHQMAVEAGVMKMRAIQAVEVKPGGKLEFKPGGYHLMLFDLRQPLKKGDKFPLTLTFARAGALEVSVVVEDMTLPIGATLKP
jgi:periplasmic copper chaperone A